MKNGGRKAMAALLGWGVFAIFPMGGVAAAETGAVRVTANVLTALELETVNGAIHFGIVNPGQPSVLVDPRSGGANAAAFRVTGMAARSIQICYPANVLLVPQDRPGASSLPLVPMLSGKATNSQSTSTLFLTPPARTILSGSGEYFLWLGGEITDLSGVETGRYSGNLTITVEYDL